MEKKKSESDLNQELITFNIQDELKRSEDEGDQIEINLSSQTIKIHYYQLCKYSQRIENEYQKSDTRNRLIRDIKLIQEDYKVEDHNLVTFFDIIKEGNIQLSSYQFRDLFILSEFFKVKFLQTFLERYSKTHLNDINYIINMMLSSKSNTPNEYLQNDELNNRMEELLPEKIDECIENDNFGQLPISILYRIFEKSDINKITNDKLYTFINKSIEKRHLLFHFLDIRDLTDENFNDLYNCYLEQKKLNKNIYYQYLQVDLEYIKQLKDENKNGDIIENKKLMKNIENLNTKIDQLTNENSELKVENQQLSHDINKLNSEIEELKAKNKELAEQYESIPPLIKAQIERYHQIKSKKIVEKEETKRMNVQVIKAFLAGFENKINKNNSKKNLLYVACESGIADVVRYILSQNSIDVNAKCICENSIFYSFYLMILSLIILMKFIF